MNSIGDRLRFYYLYSTEGQLLAELDAQGNTQREYLYLQSWPVAVVSYTPAVPAGSGVVATTALLVGDAAGETAEDYPEVAETAPADPKPTASTGVTTSGASDRAADGVAVSTAATPAIQLHYLHPDHLGTPRLATDSAQRIVWRWDSAPFGDTPALEDPDGDGVRFALNLRFPGQYFDAETGLHYNYFRDYDPAVGRYLESDPIGLDGGVNTYGYVEQNPIANSDVSGLLTGYKGCNKGQRGQIKAAEGKVRRAIGKICSGGCTNDNGGCVPCKYRRRLLGALQTTPVKCEENPSYCGLTPSNRSFIAVYSPLGFDPQSHCGCLEATLLHELLHVIGLNEERHRYINDIEVECFSCGKLLGPDYDDSYGNIHDIPG